MQTPADILPPTEHREKPVAEPPRLPPLCIDLDGTLVKTDTLWETAIVHLKAHPWKSLFIPFWLLAGRAQLKQRLARDVTIDCNSLPYTPELLEYLRQAHTAGREIILVSGCDRAVGDQIAKHLGLFSEVITSDGRNNVKRPAKARILNERFGTRGFDYAGNEQADVPVWAAARERLVATAPARLVRRLSEEPKRLLEFAPRRSRLPAIIRALRCHQWSKNLLVFLPLIAGHAYF